MPRYEYMCEKCEKGLEMTLSITERTKAKVTCPSCGSKKVISQITGFTPRTSRKS